MQEDTTMLKVVQTHCHICKIELTSMDDSGFDCQTASLFGLTDEPIMPYTDESEGGDEPHFDEIYSTDSIQNFIDYQIIKHFGNIIIKEEK